MKINKAVITLLSYSVIVGDALAGTIGSQSASYSRVMTLSVGPAWYSNGQSQTFFLLPDVEKTYTADKHTNAVGSGEFFLGLQGPLPHSLLGQLGLAIAATSNAKLSGDIWEDADPDFNNYSYTYHVNHAHVAVKGKLIADRGYWMQPYLSGSLGLGFNHAHDFTITPKIFEEVPAPSFKSHTTTAFTYTLGLGAQKSWTPNWQMGIGYELASWGNSYLSPAPGQTVNNGLKLNNFYTHQLQFSLSYVV